MKLYNTSLVLAYLEERIIDGIATQEEEHVYQDVKWFGKPNRTEWKMVIRNMKNQMNI